MATNALRNCLFAFALALLATSVCAAPIKYTYTFTATGTAGTQSFSNAPISIVLTGDTSAITSNTLAITRNPVAATITIGGVGVGTITEPVTASTACGVFPQAGMERAPFILIGNFVFTGLTIPYPVCHLNTTASVTGLTPGVQQFSNVASTLGPISLTISAPVTYQAVLNPAVPVPTVGSAQLTVLAIIIAFLSAMHFIDLRWLSRMLGFARRITRPPTRR